MHLSCYSLALFFMGSSIIRFRHSSRSKEQCHVELYWFLVLHYGPDHRAFLHWRSCLKKSCNGLTVSWARGSSADTDPLYPRDNQVGVQPSLAGLLLKLCSGTSSVQSRKGRLIFVCSSIQRKRSIQRRRLLGCAHRFRPTYALANVGHPSIPSDAGRTQTPPGLRVALRLHLSYSCDAGMT